MTSTDVKVQLVVNKLTRSQYSELESQSKIDNNQIYIITDEQDVPNLVSSIASSYNKTNTYIDGQLSDLSVNNVTETQMAAILEQGSIPSNAIYLVSSDTENVYGQRITNVGTPINDSDAATKAYVDAHSGGGSGGGSSGSTTNLSNYYTKSETNALSTTFRNGLATTTQLTSYETKSDLTSNYYTKTNVNTISSSLSNAVTSNYYTKTQANSISSSLSNAVTANYYTKTQANAISTSLSNTITANYYQKTATSSATELTTQFAKHYLKTETSSATEIDTAVENLYTYIDQHDQMSILTASSSTITPAYGTYTRIEASTVNSASQITINVSAPTDDTHTQTYSSASNGFEVRIDGSGLSTSKSCVFSGTTVVSMDDEAGVIVVGKVAYVTFIWNGSEIEVFWRNATV